MKLQSVRAEFVMVDDHGFFEFVVMSVVLSIRIPRWPYQHVMWDFLRGRSSEYVGVGSAASMCNVRLSWTLLGSIQNTSRVRTFL
jgi:hypothetical protein